MRKLPLYMQQEQAECGLACVAMLAAFFGHEVDLLSLRLRFPCSEWGMNLLALRNLCWTLQLNAQVLRVELQELFHLATPCILHWNLNHFVVLKRVRGKRFCIHDPAVGERICSQQEMSDAFTGIILVIEPSLDFQKLQLKKRMKWWNLIQNIQGYKRTIGLMLIFSLFLEMSHIVPVCLMQYTLDVMANQDLTNLKALLWGSFLLSITLMTLTFIKERKLLRLSTQFKAQFCINAMQHIMRLPLNFFQKRLQGHIHLSFQALEAVQKQMSIQFMEMLMKIGLLMMNGMLMGLYSLGLSLCVFASTGLVLLLRYLSQHKSAQFHAASFHRRGQYMSHFIESLQNMIALKSSSKEMARWGQWRHLYVEALNADTKISKLNISVQSFQQGLQQTEYIVLIGLGAVFIHLNTLSLGMFMAFLFFRQNFANGALEVSNRIFQYQMMRVELERVQDVMSQVPEETTGRHDFSFMKGALRLDSVAFRYDLFPYLFKDLSFEVNAGEKVAIIGPSGCGKTTLLKLMLGLIQPIHGHLFIDEVPLSSLSLSQYRHQVASVMQEDRLFSASLIENIVFFEDKIDHAWLEEVCALANMVEFIKTLPMGYHTPVGEQGYLLSGGQKQRLLLARALYKRPKILFLDEATSHLDAPLEKKINAALKPLSMTQIVIAHRKETIEIADRVIELGGKI